MFQFSAFAHLRVYSLQLYGFPHSEMSGSQDICSSPNLIAAYHVLLRLSEPRHPPCALSNLLISIYSSLILLLQSIPICQRTLLFLYLALASKGMNDITIILTINQEILSFENFKMWRITESNRWPPACKAGALASWANPPIFQFM